MAKRLNDAVEVIIMMILGLMVFVAGVAEEPCGRTACGGRAAGADAPEPASRLGLSAASHFAKGETK